MTSPPRQLKDILGLSCLLLAFCLLSGLPGLRQEREQLERRAEAQQRVVEETMLMQERAVSRFFSSHEELKGAPLEERKAAEPLIWLRMENAIKTMELEKLKQYSLQSRLAATIEKQETALFAMQIAMSMVEVLQLLRELRGLHASADKFHGYLARKGLTGIVEKLLRRCS